MDAVVTHSAALHLDASASNLASPSTPPPPASPPAWLVSATLSRKQQQATGGASGARPPRSQPQAQDRARAPEARTASDAFDDSRHDHNPPSDDDSDHDGSKPDIEISVDPFADVEVHPGLVEVWRIVAMRPEQLSIKAQGTFYNHDAYVVLSVDEAGKAAVFFWVRMPV